MKSVALLIYSCPFHFPPTINAANILAEKGYDVHLFGLKNEDNWSQQLDERVRLTFFGEMTGGFYGWKNFFKSIFFLRRYFKKHHVGTLISYDAISVLPAYLSTKSTKTKWIFHQHDFWEAPKGRWQSLLWKAERKLTRFAYKVSFPQTQRAEYFQKVAGLKEMPVIVYNGPRKKWLQPGSSPDPVITAMREKFRYVLIYQGGWSLYFGLEAIFDALAVCKTDTCLIMLGEEREKGVRDSYLAYLDKLGISDKVYLAEKYIPYEALPGFTQYADAAIGKLTGDSDDAPFNDRFLIGAANKITEYIACGLPVILQDSAPNRAFFKEYPVGILTDSNDKNVFAKAIDDLMNDGARRSEMAHANRSLFESELNFDHQFQKIIDLL
jgi:glycosyltransferase involved in cell wall biosynthesis